MHGVHLRVAHKLLGHSSITQTQRYSHLEALGKRQAILLLDSPEFLPEHPGSYTKDGQQSRVP